jgi:hypothetical protein
MRKFLATILTILTVFIWSGGAALAESGSREDWIAAEQARLAADAEYRQALLSYQTDKTPENEEALIEAAKKAMDSALDAADAWLVWKESEAESDSRVPESIKTNISNDVAKNRAKIETLRSDVSNVQTQLQAGLVFLKLVGSYVELLADVARNTGSMWVHIGEQWVTKTEGYEADLREAAEKLSDNSAIIAKLDVAKGELATAKSKVALAKTAYEKVRLPGTPFVKFAEGNAYLRQAQTNLLNAQAQLVGVFTLIGQGNK